MPGGKAVLQAKVRVRGPKRDCPEHRGFLWADPVCPLQPATGACTAGSAARLRDAPNVMQQVCSRIRARVLQPLPSGAVPDFTSSRYSRQASKVSEARREDNTELPGISHVGSSSSAALLFQPPCSGRLTPNLHQLRQ